MKYLLIALLLLFAGNLFSQGAGIRYVDSIPTNSPNTDIRQSVMVYNRSDSLFYIYQKGSWTLLDTIETADIADLELISIVKRVTTNQATTSGSNVVITDLVFDVEAGKSYAIEAAIRGSATNGENVFLVIDGTATATTFFARRMNSTTSSIINTLGDDIGFFENDYVFIVGFITVDSAGTLSMQFNVGSSETATIFAGSYMTLTPTSN